MASKNSTVAEYLEQLPEDRQAAINQLREAISKGLPEGFEEALNYGMVGYVVPHTRYPGGYHCDPKLPLPFINLASRKGYIALYHMGIYADATLHDWFVEAYQQQVSTKLDMGKSCVRFKKIEHIPYALVEELCSKMSVDDWVKVYEANIKR